MVRFRMHQLKPSNESRTTARRIPDCSVSSCSSWLQAEGVVSACWSWFHCCFICSCTWRGRQKGKLLQFVSVNIHSLLSTSSSCPKNTLRMTPTSQGTMHIILVPTPNYPRAPPPPAPPTKHTKVLFAASMFCYHKKNLMPVSLHTRVMTFTVCNSCCEKVMFSQASVCSEGW